MNLLKKQWDVDVAKNKFKPQQYASTANTSLSQDNRQVEIPRNWWKNTITWNAFLQLMNFVTCFSDFQLFMNFQACINSDFSGKAMPHISCMPVEMLAEHSPFFKYTPLPIFKLHILIIWWVSYLLAICTQNIIVCKHFSV